MSASNFRFVGLVVAAQVLAQVGTFTLPALLPGFMTKWSLSATEAGWLIGAYFAAYVMAVPVLVSLTDRVPARRIYLLGSACTMVSHFGFALFADGFWSGLVLRAIAGMGWAGCYMPGLKVLADRLEGDAQSRAVSLHAAGVGIAGAVSFIIAGAFDAVGGARAAFLFAGSAAAVAFVLGGLAMTDGPRHRPVATPSALLDFRPVFQNRAAMAWIAGYTIHTWELAALRAWAVTFLAATAVLNDAPAWLPDPTVVFTVAGLIGIAASIFGNETAQRFGRARVVACAMGTAAVLALATGLSSLVSAPLAALCVVLWNAAIYLDSSALTAGTVRAATPSLRGATMGLHSMCGYAGGFLGPIGIGLVLDHAGSAGSLGWPLAFGLLSAGTLAGLWILRHLAPSNRPEQT